ncbi:MAG TPA: hypothetical protein VL285_19915 [Bryobacteraceae bacterium]|nr:hypothetical protein [Bryobacteraceae bacterium]
MRGLIAWPLLWAAVASAQTDGTPDPMLARIQERVLERLARLPDYVCVQTVERAHRASAKEPFKPIDTLRLQVALINGKEQYAWLDARRFDDRELRDLVGRGAVGTGIFALHTRHVFQPKIAEFKARGEETREGRRVLRYDYEVPWENSAYRVRNPPHEEVVAFRGSALIDAETLDLLQLVVSSDEIPQEIGMDRISTTLEYGRSMIGAQECVLPTASEMTIAGLDGTESRNRTKLGECRQYTTESKLTFEEPASEAAAPSEKEEESEAAQRLTMELALESDIALETAVVGDPVRAVLSRPLKDGDKVWAPAGSVALGNIVRLEKQGQPFDHYEIAMEFHSIESAAGRLEYSATMTQAGPAPGLIRQAKKLNPTFTRQRRARMEILVREVPKGQGVLHWEAKHARIRKAFRMRWLVHEIRPAR